MAKKIILIFLFFNLFFLNSLFADNNLYIKESGYDFGVVVKGDKYSHIFNLKNIGDTDLLISKIFPTCGCLIMEKNYPTIIKANEDMKLKVLFDSADKKIGKGSNSIYIVLGNNESIKSIKIDYLVQTSIKISPNKIYLPPQIIFLSEPQKIININISSLTNSKLNISHLTYNKNLFSVNLNSFDSNTIMELKLNKTVQPGKYNDRITFALDKTNDIYIPVEFEITNIIDYKPEQIIFTEYENKKYIDIYSTVNKKFETKISYDKTYVNAVLKKLKDFHYQIIVSTNSQQKFNSSMNINISDQLSHRKIFMNISNIKN